MVCVLEKKEENMKKKSAEKKMKKKSAEKMFDDLNLNYDEWSTEEDCAC
jgi:hypothetical protein